MSAPVLEGKAAFALRGHNPDVLTCIANLSNDEVFTPPELAGQMLDTIEEAWAAAHGGASIWSDPTVTFLDPFTKSGVFLREIVSRLTEGLEEEIPDLRDRVDHILTTQVYGIGITQLTALLARRSVYCSKDATGEHSIAGTFDRDWGNIWFERTEHTWAGSRCAYCGASTSGYERGDGRETHAYAFIHTTDIKTRLAHMFGADVQFDVIIGNPPYQLTDAAGGGSDASIYNLFVEQAERLQPRFLSMVIPSRWMAGGRGLDEFRTSMLGNGHLRQLVDYPNAKDVFPGVEVKGGICYFLWDQTHRGDCMVTTIRGRERTVASRKLDEFDVFVRDPLAASILRKVLSFGEESVANILTNTEPFKFESNFTGYHLAERPGDVRLYYIGAGKRSSAFVSRHEISKNQDLIESWKVLVVRGYGAGETIPHQILGIPQIAPPASVCTGSYMFFYVDSESAAESLQSYIVTRFFRFLVSLRKITQHAFRSTYSWVPVLPWDRVWTDDMLNEKYGLTDDEVDFIKSQVKQMAVGGADESSI